MAARRTFLQAAGLLAAVGAIGGCGGSTGRRADGELAFWDHWQPERKLMDEYCQEFSRQKGNLRAVHTSTVAGKMGQALTLAKQSNQLPDVFTAPGLGLPPRQLIENGWFHEMQMDAGLREGLPDGTLFNGMHIFDGKLYSFPLFSPKVIGPLIWRNTALFAKAGVDPATPPTTYDEFRAAAKTIRRSGAQTYGVVLALKGADGLENHVHQMAQAAGLRAMQGVDIRTGEFVYHADEYAHVVELLLAIKSDGSMHPASSNLVAIDGRARWASGQIGMFMDGQFCIGVLVRQFAQFTDKVDVGPVLLPQPSAPGQIHHPPKRGVYWIGATTKHPDQASKLATGLATKEFQRKWVAQMGSMSIYPDVVATDVHPTFTKSLEMIKRQVFLGPAPVVRNQDVSLVDAALKPVKPGLGEIIQGALSGDVPDWKAALRKLSAASMAAREKAIGAARAKGAKVSETDYTFPDWVPGKDYTKY